MSPFCAVMRMLHPSFIHMCFGASSPGHQCKTHVADILIAAIHEFSRFITPFSGQDGNDRVKADQCTSAKLPVKLEMCSIFRTWNIGSWDHFWLTKRRFLIPTYVREKFSKAVTATVKQQLNSSADIHDRFLYNHLRSSDFRFQSRDRKRTSE